MLRKLTPEEIAAIAILTKHGRVLAILIPDGIPTEVMKQLTKDIDDTLDMLVKEYAEAKALEN